MGSLRVSCENFSFGCLSVNKLNFGVKEKKNYLAALSLNFVQGKTTCPLIIVKTV